MNIELKLNHLLKTALLLAVVLFSVACGKSEGTDDSCTAGETKNADDGCNTCTCTEDGEFECTENSCTTYNQCSAGETMDAGDNCNTCSCSSGQWLCTKNRCDATPTPDPLPKTCELGDGDTYRSVVGNRVNCGRCACVSRNNHTQWHCSPKSCDSIYN